MCQAWQYDEQTGEIVRHPPISGGPLPRIGGAAATPCRKPAKCPKGTPEDSKELNAKNRQAYAHYLECRAVGVFPDDAIVRQNAAIIRRVQDAFDRKERFDLALPRGL